MKNNFSIVLNIILFVAVVVLYYLHFAYASSDLHKIKEADAAVANSFKIAYFDLDTLQDKYEDFKAVRKYLTSKDSEMTQQLNSLKTNYMNKAREYQQKGASLSQTEQTAYQQDLMRMQNDYQQKQQEMDEDMRNESMSKLQEVKNKIQNFLKSYCKEKGYAYVFASSNDDYLYYKDTLGNITSDLVQQLNALSKNAK